MIDLANYVRQARAEMAAKVREQIAAMSDADLLAWVERVESPTAELRAERASRPRAAKRFTIEVPDGDEHEPADDEDEEVAKGTARPPVDAVLAVLKEGPASVGQIAHQTGLARVRTQNCLQHLRRKGLARSPAKRGGDWKAT